MDQLKKKTGVLLLFVLLSTVLVLVARPARGNQARSTDELTHKTYLSYVALNANAQPPLFGVQTYGSTTPGAVYTPFLLESTASWVRVPISWHLVEPVNTIPANFNWGAVDSALAISDQPAPRVIATIVGSPDWAADGPRAPIYAHMMSEFAQFVGALVERYDGDGYEDAPGNPVVLNWEFYNEPDASLDYWDPGWGDNGAAYAQMLQTVYPAVKQANYKANVVFGGIAYDWWESSDGPFVESFLDDVLSAGAGPYFDIMNFHTYPSFWRNWTDDASSGLYEKAQAVRAKLQNYNLSKPLIITEAGWHSSNELLAPSSPEEQARYVIELFVESMAAEIDVMIWWMLYDPGGGYYANGLVTDAPNPTPKPAFTAYKTLVARLSTAEFVRRVPTPPMVTDADGIHSMDAYEFRDPVNRRTAYIAWMNPVNGDRTWNLRLPVAQATKYNIYNTSSSVVHDGDDGVLDGHITVPVSSQPLYVEVPW